VGEAVWVPEVVEASLQLLRSFGYHGLSQVEFKRDARDGRYKLMEINPRLWQWHGLASACGVDLPRIAYADLIGKTPPDAHMNGNGKRWAITLLPGETPAPQRPPYVDAVFAVDDPKPALVHLARVARSVVA
jgi:predicted ATP-grasp superfamily ATP-dependent carboligase